MVRPWVTDFANMGFTRDQVRGVIRQLTDSGQSVDLNVVGPGLLIPATSFTAL